MLNVLTHLFHRHHHTLNLTTGIPPGQCKKPWNYTPFECIKSHCSADISINPKSFLSIVIDETDKMIMLSLGLWVAKGDLT